MDGKEIELKLAIAPQALAKLKRLPLLKAHSATKPATKTLRSVYFDTPDHILAQAGITARLRTGNHDVLQTVKTAGSRSSGLFSRQEWEAQVPGPGLDYTHLAACGLAPLRDDAVVTALSPVFATHIRRSLYLLHGEDWQVELAIDVGEVRAGERVEAICEVELELKQGRQECLFDLAHQVADAVPARLLTQSKSDRGYDLAAGRGPEPVKARPVTLNPDAPAAEAFRVIARNCLHHLLANQQSLLERGDGEAVHQMRVALRRLRSALKVFRPLVAGPQLAVLKQEMRWLLGQLGPARDAEVFLSEIIAPVVARHPGHDGLIALADHCRTECADDLRAARAAVDEKRFTLLLLNLGAWVEAGDWCADAARRADRPLAPFARHVLGRLARKLDKAGGKKLRRLSPPALHQVRIHGKQLRYAGEFFASLYRKGETRDYLATLGKLQDCLGQINDISVAAPKLAACHHLGETAWAAGVVTGWHDARRPELAAAADTLWTDFRQCRKFWKA